MPNMTGQAYPYGYPPFSYPPFPYPPGPYTGHNSVDVLVQALEKLTMKQQEPQLKGVPKLQPMKENDDLDFFLEKFERQMLAQRNPRNIPNATPS